MGQSLSSRAQELRILKRALVQGSKVLEADFVTRFHNLVDECPQALLWKDERGETLLMALFCHLSQSLERKDSLHHFSALLRPRAQTSRVFRMRNSTGWTLLHMACKFNPSALDVISFILEQRPDAAGEYNDWYQTPLHIACIHRAPLPVVERLVQQCPRAVHAFDLQGQTPLHDHFTSGGASLGVTRLLVMQELAVCLAEDGDGDLPLDVAKCCKKHGEQGAVVEFLTSITNTVAGVVMDELSDSETTDLDKEIVESLSKCSHDGRETLDIIRSSLTTVQVYPVLQRGDVRSKILARVRH